MGDPELEHEIRRLVFIREETRFEIGLLHDRINALIGAEAFLTIAFTMALSAPLPRTGVAIATVVPPILSMVGLTLAIISWPGIDATFQIILEWDARQLELVRGNDRLAQTMWRRDVSRRGTRQQMTMLFARAGPLVFAVAWAIVTCVAILVSLQRERS